MEYNCYWGKPHTVCSEILFVYLKIFLKRHLQNECGYRDEWQKRNETSRDEMKHAGKDMSEEYRKPLITHSYINNYIV